MVNDSPVKTAMFEYRETTEAGSKLVAVSLTDMMRDGLSMVYTFFDPDLKRQSLGTCLILDHIAQAAQLGVPHVYLGYWIKGSPKMDYKRRFRPLEVLDGNTWRQLSDDE